MIVIKLKLKEVIIEVRVKFIMGIIISSDNFLL